MLKEEFVSPVEFISTMLTLFFANGIGELESNIHQRPLQPRMQNHAGLPRASCTVRPNR
jgi:hypothetical protein